MKTKFMIIVLVLIAVLLTAQIIIIPANVPQVRYVQGDDLQWYIYCENRCLQLLEVDSVDNLYSGYADIDDAVQAYQTIYALLPK